MHNFGDPEDYAEDPPLVDSIFGEPDLLPAKAFFDFSDTEDSLPALDAEQDSSSARAHGPSSSKPSKPLARVEDDSPQENVAATKVYGGAGKIYGWEKSVYEKYKSTHANSSASANPYAPFSCETAWLLAKWAKQSKTGDNDLSRLLAIPTVSCSYMHNSWSLTAVCIDGRETWAQLQ